MLWASSQATPLRRLRVANNLVLFQYTDGDAAGFASGGFIANSVVDGKVVFPLHHNTPSPQDHPGEGALTLGTFTPLLTTQGQQRLAAAVHGAELQSRPRVGGAASLCGALFVVSMCLCAYVCISAL